MRVERKYRKGKKRGDKGEAKGGAEREREKKKTELY